MQNLRTYHFNEGPVVAGLCASGEYGAYRLEDDLIRGHGHSVMAAIADLNKKIEAAGEDRPDDYRTPFTGQDKIDWENDHRRALEMVS